MLNFLKKQKAILIAGIVLLLGWFGVQVTKEQVTPYVDKSIELTEDVGNLKNQYVQKREQEKQTEQQRQAEETTNNPASTIKDDFNEAGLINVERQTHILYGDASGGGHLYGVGRPCKSEFP